ncbi:hypothetical protein [Nannocystis exedens]|nr:hypothetical protein [Nannocystis exedens]
MALATLALGLVACASQRPPDPPPLVEARIALQFEAVVRVAEPQSGDGEPFRGAFVEQDDGTRWVVTSRADSPFHELRDRRVTVEGTPYKPPGQTTAMKHLRVTVMKLVEVGADNLLESPSLVEIHGEETLSGRFEMFTYPEGTKLAGEKMLVFVDERGTSYRLARVSRTARRGKVVTVTGHRVEPTPFIARPGGPYLWIVDIRR